MTWVVGVWEEEEERASCWEQINNLTLPFSLSLSLVFFFFFFVSPLSISLCLSACRTKSWRSRNAAFSLSLSLFRTLRFRASEYQVGWEIRPSKATCKSERQANKSNLVKRLIGEKCLVDYGERRTAAAVKPEEKAATTTAHSIHTL